MNNRTSNAITAPYGLWMAVFIVAPLAIVAYYALTDAAGNFSLDNITQLSLYTDTIFRSVWFGLVATILCLVTAYPLAYIFSKTKASTQTVLVMLIMIPMWMNFLIRTYAWMTILQDTGIFNGLLDMVGLGPVHIIGTEAAVVIGMVYDYLPHMVIPIYSVMAKMDNRLLEAAQDLGCNSVQVLRRVVWPLSLPGVFSGINMVLIPSISTFYISQKLGNGKFFLIGDAIEGQYIANNLHFAATDGFTANGECVAVYADNINISCVWMIGNSCFIYYIIVLCKVEFICIFRKIHFHR